MSIDQQLQAAVQKRDDRKQQIQTLQKEVDDCEKLIAVLEPHASGSQRDAAAAKRAGK